MKKIALIFILGFVIINTSCIKQEPKEPEICIENGVIVCQDPLWKVPHDIENRIASAFSPYCQFDGKVIVETYKDKTGGMRCMEIETGEVIWEQYVGEPGEYLIIQDTYFNSKQKYLIFSFGSWRNTKHIKLDINTGRILWESSIETFNTMEAYAGHYYCTVRSSGDVHPIYKVDIATGQAAFYYETDLPPDPDYNAQRSNWACPFEYNGKEYLFIGIMQMTSPNSANYYYSLMDANTQERLLKHVSIESVVEKVDVYDEDIYVFTGNGYKVFNMETLTFEKEVQLLQSGEYVYHQFYKDKLILGLYYLGKDWHEDNGEEHTHFIIDTKTHTKELEIYAYVKPSGILDDIMYLVSSGKHFYAYNIITGNCLMDIKLDYDATDGGITYKNDEGEKFVIVGDMRYTYCYEGL